MALTGYGESAKSPVGLAAELAFAQQGSSPSPRYGHAMAYDSDRGVVVLFGGYDGAFDGDTWEWDGSAWSLRATTGPGPRRNHAMA